MTHREKKGPAISRQTYLLPFALLTLALLQLLLVGFDEIGQAVDVSVGLTQEVRKTFVLLLINKTSVAFFIFSLNVGQFK